MSNEFSKHLAKQGTARYLTVHDSPQSNGASECINCTILNLVRAMIIVSGLKVYLWAEAVCQAVWLDNRTSMQSIPEGITPYEKAIGETPDLSNLIEWGKTVWVKIKNPTNGKLGPYAMEVHFVGYDNESKGYRIFWSNTRKVSIKRDIYFNKNDVFLPETAHSEGENVSLETKPDHTKAISGVPEPNATPKTSSESPLQAHSNALLKIPNGSKLIENVSKQSEPSSLPSKTEPLPTPQFPHQKSSTLPCPTCSCRNDRNPQE